MNADRPAELHQVLGALASNREPGWNLPGHLLALTIDDEAPGSTRLSLEPGSHCLGTDGQVELAALCVLADVGMSLPMRKHLGVAGRMATVSMQIVFTGAPRRGRLSSHGALEGMVEGTGQPLGITRAEIRAGDALVCVASGTFVSLGNRQGLVAPRLRRRGDDRPAPTLAPEDLDDAEQAVFARAQAALQPGAGSFLERFWGLQPVATEGGAACEFSHGLHVGNRVGHTQGGITFALGALTANAAFGAGWQLVRASSSYVSPGQGDALQARTNIVHQGRLTAVAQTEIRDLSGKLVLETVTNHARVG